MAPVMANLGRYVAFVTKKICISLIVVKAGEKDL